MTGRYDEEIPDHDERLHLRDRGVGRDIGRNPTYRGIKPRTRQDTRALTTMESVGSWGTAEETITSMSQQFVPFIVMDSTAVFTQTLVQGAGSLTGFVLTLVIPGNGALVAELYDGRTGRRLYNCVAATGNATRQNNVVNISQRFGDWGVSFNNLVLKTWRIDPPGNPIEYAAGVVTLASIE